MSDVVPDPRLVHDADCTAALHDGSGVAKVGCRACDYAASRLATDTLSKDERRDAFLVGNVIHAKRVAEAAKARELADSAATIELIARMTNAERAESLCNIAVEIEKPHDAIANELLEQMLRVMADGMLIRRRAIRRSPDGSPQSIREQIQTLALEQAIAYTNTPRE